MKCQYESEILSKLMERDGFNIPSSVPPYEAEIKAYLINQVKQAYPKLTDYEAEWLLYNYTKHIPAEFPIRSVSEVTEATFENVVPFAYQSAILKGQTLVNLVDYSHSNSSHFTKQINGHWSISVENNSKMLHLFNPLNQPLKDNTLYTVIVDVTKNNLSQGLRLINGYTTGKSVDLPLGYIGKIKLAFTTKTSAASGWNGALQTVVLPETTGEIELGDYILLEGDYTNIDIPYFEGMQSVKMPVLTTTGKNLLEWKKLFTNELVDGYETNKGNIYVPVRIPVPDVNEQYTLVFSGKIDDFGSDSDFMKAFAVTVYYIDGTISQKYATNDNTTLTSTKEKIIDRIEISHPFASPKPEYTARIKDIALYQGSVATPYEPYKSNILSTPEDLELRGIGNVKDELNLMTGELTQRIGEIVLDGSEKWQIRNDLSGGETTAFYIAVPDKKKGGLMVADKLKTITGIGSFANNTIEDSRWSGGYFFIHKNISSVNDFKTWLSQNNITVQYELAQEVIVKTVDLTTVNEKGETTYFMPLEGAMNVQSSGEIIQPTFDMSVPVEATTQNLASFIDLEME